jgi:hypothetical protein
VAGDLDAVRETVFDLIGGLCRDAGDAAGDAVGDAVGDTEVFPSDLEGLEELSAEERAELYENLVFNRYLDTDGTVLWADFTEPANAAAFWVNADVGAARTCGVEAPA